MSAWLGVACADHVQRGQRLGIAQINHGRRAGLARMRAGDTVIYYSPTQVRGGSDPLQAFTAIGTVADGEIWQADEGDFLPYRRAVDYAASHPVRVAELRDQLDLTSERSWGYQLRRGLVELSDADAELIRSAMLD